MRPPAWLLATLQRLLPARSPKRTNTDWPGLYRSANTDEPVMPAPLSLEDDRRPIAPVDHEATRQIRLGKPGGRHRAGGDRFPDNGAVPRILPGRAEVPDGDNGDVFDRNTGGHHPSRWGQP